MKNILMTLLLMSTTSAFADVTGHVGYESDYMWRGVSQSQGASSFNASIELDTNGFFVGATYNDVDYLDNDATNEKDLYVGYKLDVMDNLDVSIGLIQYRFDGGLDRVEEGFVKVGYNSLNLAYFVDTDSEDDYAFVSYDLWFINGFDASIGYGYHDRNDDFSILNVSKDINNFTLSAKVMLDEAFENQTTDSVSFGLSYNF